jgi:hypothetical protein
MRQTNYLHHNGTQFVGPQCHNAKANPQGLCPIAGNAPTAGHDVMALPLRVELDFAGYMENAHIPLCCC